MKILIADDEEVFLKLIGDFLINDGYDIILASNGREALLEYQKNDNIDLILLDVMMPEIDGLKVCSEIKKSCKNIPILILTAKDTEEDQIQAFKSGADDYISKPFSFQILLLRIKALLKRNDSLDIIEYENIKIFINKHIVLVNNNQIELTPKEFELLILLIKNKNNVISREKILSSIWDYSFFGDNRTVDTHIKNLRLKINDDGTIIKTVRGYGYKIGE